MVGKPAGLLSVPGKGEGNQDCLSRRVQAAWPDALTVHRLDMATSGLLTMARSPPMQRALSELFANRSVFKRYVAVVSGMLPVTTDWQLIDFPIAQDWPRRPLRVVDPAAGKPSQTRWRAIAVDAAAGTSTVELEPLTGRTHQLRVHLQAIGHPILGDALYAPAAVLAAAPRLLLHAVSLGFVHPASGQRVQFESPAPFV